MTRDEALIIAEGLVVTDIATPEEIADAIFNAWSEGYSEGERDGYSLAVNDEIDLSNGNEE